MEDWEKEEQLQKTFESIIQQMQASKATLETSLGNQLPMQESFGPPKIGIDFADDGVITKKQTFF